MKKIICFLLILSLISLPAYAADTVSVTITPDAFPAFVKTGDELVITATARVEYSDGTSADEVIDGAVVNTSVLGRQRIPLTAHGHTEYVYVTVMNEAADMSVYRDLPKIHWGYKSIRRCVMAGIMGGVSESSFSPSSNISRAQFCQLIYNIYINDSSIISTENTVSFSDVPAEAWYSEAVSACASSGIVFGDGDCFYPDKPVTRQDAAVMLMRILKGDLTEADSDSLLETARQNGIPAIDFDEADGYAKTALAASLGTLIDGNEKGEIRPKADISRAECASMISNYFFDGYNDPAIKKLVYLSPSRQIHNPYKGINTSEGEQMYIVAGYTKAKLEEMGYDVYIADIERYIKYDDCRADEAKALGADVYVAIHSNATQGKNNGGENGAICFYNGNNAGAKELAQSVYGRVSALTPTSDNGIENDMLTKIPFAEIRLPEMANILLEVEYHDYYSYAKWIVDNVRSIGEAIAYGIDDYFRLYNI